MNPRTEILSVAREEGRSALLEHEAYALIRSLGIDVPPHAFVPVGSNPDPLVATIDSERVVLKIVSPQISHKSDVGGVHTVANTTGAIRAGIAAMLDEVGRRAPAAELRGVLVVERLEYNADLPGTEYLLSLRRDPAFGAVIFFGMGGLLAEWYGRLSPGGSRVLFAARGFDRAAAIAALRKTELGEIALRAGRTHEKAPVDAEALGEALERLASRAEEPLDSDGALLEELEINPIVASGGRLVALDGLARIGAAAESARPPRPVAQIRHLLHPASAAVWGASSRVMNAGRIILRNLKTGEGLTYGHVYAVHPSAETIEGVLCYRSTAELPEPVDLAVVSVPATAARDTVAELVAQQKAKSIILIPGGFAETGRAALAEEIEQTLSAPRREGKEGPIMVGGNCLGIVSKNEYNTFFLPNYKLPFNDAPGDNLAVVSQSGAYLVSFTSNLDSIIYPKASISYGNEMDLTAADFLEYYLEHEPQVSIFCFYIEGFPPNEGRRFVELVRRATNSGRPVVVYKAGQTSHGASAAATHTGSMAGDYEVASALLRNAGAVVTGTLNMLEDYTKVLTMLDGKRPSGRRVGVVTNAGFEAGAVGDHLYSLRLAGFSPETTRTLKSVLPSIAHTGNPIDTTPMADTAGFVAAVEAVASDPGVDMLIVSAIPAAPTLDVLAPDLSRAHSENIFAMGSLPAELIRLGRTVSKPMVVAIDSGRLYDPSVLLLEGAGIPAYRKIDRASRALSKFADVHLEMLG